MKKSSELYHYGIKGMKWGVRRFQNEDGSLTPEGEKRYGVGSESKGVDRVDHWGEKYRAVGNMSYRTLPDSTASRPRYAFEVERNDEYLSNDEYRARFKKTSKLLKSLTDDDVSRKEFIKQVRDDGKRAVAIYRKTNDIESAVSFINDIYGDDYVISGSLAVDKDGTNGGDQFNFVFWGNDNNSFSITNKKSALFLSAAHKTIRHSDELYHHGIKGMKWGVRRFQNEDGSYKAGAEGRYNPDGLPGVHKAKAAMAKVREKFRNKDIHVKQRQEKPPKPQKTPEELEAEKERRKKILRNVAIGAGVAVGAAVVYKCGKTYVNNIKAQNMALYQQESQVIFSSISNVKMNEINEWASSQESKLKEAENAFGAELSKREKDLNDFMTDIRQTGSNTPETAGKIHKKNMEFMNWKKQAEDDIKYNRDVFNTEKALRSGDASKQAMDAVNAYQSQHKKPMRYTGQDDDFRTAYKRVHDYKKYGTMSGLDQAISGMGQESNVSGGKKISKVVEDTILGRGSLRDNMREYVDGIKKQNADLYKKEADMLLNTTAAMKLSDIDKQRIPYGASDAVKATIEKHRESQRKEAIKSAQAIADAYRKKHDQSVDEDNLLTAYRRVKNYRKYGALDIARQIYGG